MAGKPVQDVRKTQPLNVRKTRTEAEGITDQVRQTKEPDLKASPSTAKQTAVEPPVEIPPPAEKKKRPAKEKKPATGNHAALIKHFCDGWQQRHGLKYPFCGAKDGAAASAILKALDDDLNRATGIADAFLDDPDDWLKGKHNLAMLRSRLTQYLESDNGSQAAELKKAEQQFLAEFGR
jgi:hypothetical protein